MPGLFYKDGFMKYLSNNRFVIFVTVYSSIMQQLAESFKNSVAAI